MKKSNPCAKYIYIPRGVHDVVPRCDSELLSGGTMPFPSMHVVALGAYFQFVPSATTCTPGDIVLLQGAYCHTWEATLCTLGGTMSAGTMSKNPLKEYFFT